jgi:hypothetical protein
MSLDLYVWVLNLLNRDNPTTVYTSSGSPRTTNFLNTGEGQNAIAQNGPDFERLYRLATLNPNLFENPRQVRLGAKLSF